MRRWVIFRGPMATLGRRALVVVLGLVAPAAFANQAPVVDIFTASPAAVAPGGAVTLTLEAHDPDCPAACTAGCGTTISAALTSWSASGGTFSNQNNGTTGSPYSASAVWQAPDVEGLYTIEVYLADSGTILCGGRQAVTPTLVVQVTSNPNAPPVVESLTANPSRIFPGETSVLECVASDPDGDPLDFDWSTDLGTVTPGAHGAATFTSDRPGAATVTCTVTDPSGAPGSRSVVVSASDVRAETMLADGLVAPQRLAVDSLGDLLVADGAGGGISVLSLETGRLLYRLAVPGVTSVATDWADRLVVGGADGAVVTDRSGVLLRALTTAPVADVAVDRTRQRYVVLDRSAGRVEVYDEVGQPLWQFGSTGDGADQLRGPSGVAVAPVGEIVVADTGHGQLKVYTADGTFLRAIGSSGAGVGEMVEVDDVEVGPDGVIWASDAFQGWVQSFDPDGSVREVVGTYGDGVGRLKTAAGIAVSEGYHRLVVASVNTPAVQVFQLGPEVPVEWPQAVPSLSVDHLVFPEQAVGGTSDAHEVVLSNQGTAPLGVRGVRTVGPFSVAEACPVVEPGGACSLWLRFVPQAPGAQQGQLTVDAGSSDTPLVVTLDGVGFVPGQAVLDTDNLDFGRQIVAGASVVRWVTMTNVGTAPLAITAVTATAPFALDSHCPALLPGGAACGVEVWFEPVAGGHVSGTMAIHSSDPTSPHLVGLGGEGVLLELTLDPSALDLGDVNVGASSEPATAWVHNTGDEPVTLGTLILGGDHPADYAVVSDRCSGVELQLGQSCDLEVVLSPTAVGQRTARAVIPITAGLEWDLQLSGWGVEEILFADGFESGDTSAWSGARQKASVHLVPTRVEFGEVDLGNEPAAHAVRVTNSTPREVAVGAVTVTGEAAHEFAVVEDGCTSTWLDPGESCWFGVVLLTLDEGGFTATVEVPVSVVGEAQPGPVLLQGVVRWP